MHDMLHMGWNSGEGNASIGGLSGKAAADTRIPNVQKALMEFLLLGKANR
ncbi:MAG: hypothetical protein H7232_12615 [Aeromicrobium sp.]|nr:hypothetical protein [Burkholderiales bacterium]